MLTENERRAAAEAGIVVFADRLIINAQPAATEKAVAEVAARCSGPLPSALTD